VYAWRDEVVVCRVLRFRLFGQCFVTFLAPARVSPLATLPILARMKWKSEQLVWDQTRSSLSVRS